MLWQYLKRYRFSMVIAMFLAIIGGIVTAMLTSLLDPAVEALIHPAEKGFFPFEELFGVLVGRLLAAELAVDGISAKQLFAILPQTILVLALIKSSFGLVQWFMWERIGERISRSIRAQLMHGYLRLNPAQRKTDEGHAAEAMLAPAFSSDIRLLREFIVHFWGGLPREGFQVVFLALLLVLLDWRLFLIFAAGIFPIAAVLQRWGKKLRRRASSALKDFAELSEWLQQRLLGIETIKHSRTESLETQMFQALTTDLNTRYLRAARVKTRISPLVESIGFIAIGIILAISLHRIQTGEQSGTRMFSFFIALGALGQSAAKLGKYFNTNKEAAAATTRLSDLMKFLNANRVENIAHVSTLNPTLTTASVIECTDLSVIYPKKKIAALDGVSFHFHGGTIYCLCGPTGAGKSTLFNALLGLAPLTRGNIAIATREAPRSQNAFIGYMPQKISLWPESVANNVAFPEQPDKDRVLAALKKVSSADFVAGLNDSIETHIGAGGRALSGGQEQRILLARLDYHKFPIILFDEGTSALDPETEHTVFSHLQELARSGALVIMIAHRFSALKIADEILMLEHGRLHKSGSRAAMLQSTQLQNLFSIKAEETRS